MNKKVTTTLQDGTKKEYDVILTFKNDKNQKDYMLYTDNSYDQNNKLRIYAAIYNPDTLEFLGEPSSQEEWDEIYKLLDKVLLDK